jgi:hypothetical protein
MKQISLLLFNYLNEDWKRRSNKYIIIQRKYRPVRMQSPFLDQLR